MANLWEVSADTSIEPPKSFRCDYQPYGPVTIEQCVWGSYNGYPTLTGVVVAGYERSYLMGHTRDRSLVGTRYTVYGVKQFEVEQGGCTRIAC